MATMIQLQKVLVLVDHVVLTSVHYCWLSGLSEFELLTNGIQNFPIAVTILDSSCPPRSFANRAIKCTY